MKRPWMPLYIPDFLSDTMHLSAAETGAYLCLIMDYWLHDGLPDDDGKLASIARVSPKSWRRMRPTIEAFFRQNWRHKRIDSELKKMTGIAERRQQAASKAGTISAIKRERIRQNNSNGTSTPRTRDVHGASTPRAPSVHHLTQEYITSTSSEAARTRASPAENPANSTEPEEHSGAKPPATSLVAAPLGLAEQARQAVEKSSSSIGSGELIATIQARGWVKS